MVVVGLAGLLPTYAVSLLSGSFAGAACLLPPGLPPRPVGPELVMLLATLSGSGEAFSD